MRVILILLLASSHLFSQSIVDQDAKKLLDKVSQKFDAQKKLAIDFELVIRFSEKNNEVQQGSLLQDGDKFRVKIGTQEIINNGKDIYMILKDQNIAQLNSVSSTESSAEQNLLNPRELMKMYESGDYEYAIVGEDDVEGNRVILVEFKPKDRYAEYSKMRIAIMKSEETPVYFKIFNKDGTQYTLKLKELNFNPTLKADSFKFIQSQYPGIVLEDLRID